MDLKFKDLSFLDNTTGLKERSDSVQASKEKIDMIQRQKNSSEPLPALIKSPNQSVRSKGKPNTSSLPPFIVHHYSQTAPHTSFLPNLQVPEVIQTWPHVATSEAIYERKVYIRGLEAVKRKRPGRDDMEYDAPSRKGSKKNY